MTTQFITNQDKLLSDVVNNILPSAKRLYFLVGYFYFSGFQEIYKQVTDKEVKILVGLEIERDLANRIKEFQVIQEVNAPRGKIKDNYYKSLVYQWQFFRHFAIPKVSLCYANLAKT